jgi:hypothetical protein
MAKVANYENEFIELLKHPGDVMAQDKENKVIH